MLDLAKGAVAMMKMNPNPEEPLPVDLDKALQFSATGNVVRATLSIEQPELEKIMASRMMPGNGKLKASPRAGGDTEATAIAATPQATAAPVATVAVAPKPVAPARKTILIYGLAGGPKEVPVN